MDGILEELLRLEDAKHQALIALDSEVYEDSVRKQSRLIDEPSLVAGLRAAVPAGADKLLAFSKLANINTELYENLMATAPWVAVPSRSYSGDGQVADPPAVPGFSAEG